MIVPIRTKNKETLWNLVKIGSDKANRTTTGNGIDVAVVDSGVDTFHMELSSRFGQVKGYDFIENHGNPKDPNGHGTHVAGTIAGMTTGVAPECTLYAVRVLNQRGRGSLDTVLRGIDWCITKGVSIINLSLGSAYPSNLEKTVYQKALERGIVCIAAAGNEGFGANYPAAYESVIAVAAVDRFNKHAGFSNIYPTNNVSAPGVGIFSTLPGNNYGVLSGTSMATPHLSGVAALVGSQRKLDKDRYLKVLEDTALELGRENDPDNWAIYGCGLVQANKAVEVKSRWFKIA